LKKLKKLKKFYRKDIITIPSFFDKTLVHNLLGNKKAKKLGIVIISFL
jgi:hypothetical protein